MHKCWYKTQFIIDITIPSTADKLKTTICRLTAETPFCLRSSYIKQYDLSVPKYTETHDLTIDSNRLSNSWLLPPPFPSPILSQESLCTSPIESIEDLELSHQKSSPCITLSAESTPTDEIKSQIPVAPPPAYDSILGASWHGVRWNIYNKQSFLADRLLLPSRHTPSPRSDIETHQLFVQTMRTPRPLPIAWRIPFIASLTAHYGGILILIQAFHCLKMIMIVIHQNGWWWWILNERWWWWWWVEGRRWEPFQDSFDTGSHICRCDCHDHTFFMRKSFQYRMITRSYCLLRQFSDAWSRSSGRYDWQYQSHFHFDIFQRWFHPVILNSCITSSASLACPPFFDLNHLRMYDRRSCFILLVDIQFQLLSVLEHCTTTVWHGQGPRVHSKIGKIWCISGIGFRLLCNTSEVSPLWLE